MKQIIIDTDGSLEALKGISAALSDKTVTVAGITTVAFELSVDETTANVLSVLQAQRDCRTKVFRGLGRPMSGKGIPLRHAERGIPVDNSLTAASLSAKSAVDALIEFAAAGDTEIVAMGPMTNIALAFAKNRTAMSNVKKITMLAGMIFHGDVGPLSEYNFYIDPLAADAVLKTGVDITIIPIEVGSYSERTVYALHPELITKSYRSYTRIDTDGELTYGANINDVRDRNRKEFVAQSNIMHPFNCTLVADNAAEQITMEA